MLAASEPQGSLLLDRVRDKIRLKHYSIQTMESGLHNCIMIEAIPPSPLLFTPFILAHSRSPLRPKRVLRRATHVGYPRLKGYSGLRQGICVER